MPEQYTITVRVGPHPDAADLVEELLDEIGHHIDNTEITGVPVEYTSARTMPIVQVTS